MRTALLVTLALALASCSSKPAANLIAAPRIWNDRDLADWANPVAGLNMRPDHISEAEFYAGSAADWLRTYPVYFPGREPDGYWEQLQRLKPEPLITAEARTAEDWISAGKRVFEEMDVPIFRSLDSALIATVRSKDAFEKMGGHPQPDGRVHYLRWVPTAKGLALGVNDCASCHTRQLPDGKQLNGAQADDGGDGVLGALVAAGDERFFGEPPAMVAWRSFAVPWVKNDIHEQVKSMTRGTEQPDYDAARNVCTLQREPVLSNADPGPGWHQGSQVHRPYRHARPPGCGRHCKVCAARHVLRPRGIWSSPDAHARAAKSQRPNDGRADLRAREVSLFLGTSEEPAAG